jgi:hypothetical protein
MRNQGKIAGHAQGQQGNGPDRPPLRLKMRRGFFLLTAGWAAFHNHCKRWRAEIVMGQKENSPPTEQSLA